jgi:hypothetical protein
MQLLAAAAGKIQPIEVELGKEAHDWILNRSATMSCSLLSSKVSTLSMTFLLEFTLPHARTREL